MPDDAKDYRVLDFGCGKGTLVQSGIDKSIDFYGVEKYAHGSGIGIKEQIAGDGTLASRILDIENDTVPFPDATFDLVVSNQVFEHIPDIAPVLDEIHRVLKPGGKFLCIFPYLGAYREGHCEIPFAHRFQPESRLQYYWLYAFKILGFGRRKKEKDPHIWATYFSTWLKENTYYKSFSEIEGLFDSRFGQIKYIEDEYLQYRLHLRSSKLLSKIAVYPFVRPFSRWFVRKFASLVILAEKTS